MEAKLKKDLIRELNNELQDARKSHSQLQGNYEAVRSDRNLYSEQCNKLQQEVAELKDKLKNIQSQNFDHRSEIKDKKVDLRQQRDCYEAVRKDRNKYSENLIKRTTEVEDLKRKFKESNIVISRQKEEIADKQKELQSSQQMCTAVSD